MAPKKSAAMSRPVEEEAKSFEAVFIFSEGVPLAWRMLCVPVRAVSVRFVGFSRVGAHLPLCILHSLHSFHFFDNCLLLRGLR